MIYNQFSFKNQLGQLPTSSITGPKGTTFGYGGMPQRMDYGFGQSRTFQPNMKDLAASQKLEFERLQNIQGLQTGLQGVQTGALNLSEQMRKSEESKQMEAARRRIFQESDPNFMARRSLAERGTGFTQQQYVDPFYLDRAKREKELEDLAMQKARFEGSFYGGGGFTSWSTPSFPSMR